MPTILGISAFYHDSAACIIKDGKLTTAISEERLSRKKHDERLPKLAIQECLSSENLTINDIDAIVFYEKPFIKFERVLETFVLAAPLGFLGFKTAVKNWITEKLWIPSTIEKELNYTGEILFAKHHDSHAAASCFTAPFNKGAYLVMDAVGERCTTSFGTFNEGKLNPIQEQHFPHSLGMLYSAFTQYCGFKVNSGEYKLMGLAPYGTPKYVDLIEREVFQLNSDGSIELNLELFHFQKGLKMINSRFENLFGKPTRKPESEITSFYQDVAASIQKVTEKIIVRTAQFVKEQTGETAICLSGGVALNCVANAVLREAKIFDQIWIQPAAGDAGAALGSAILGYNELTKNTKQITFDHTYWGTEFDSNQIIQALTASGLAFHHVSEDEMIRKVAEQLHNQNIIGWFQGRDEWGPRALGNRSILASPTSANMQSKLNLSIKKREDFRPFAPVVLAEKASEWFVTPEESFYMQFTTQAKQGDLIPSCVHQDNSARVQTLTNEHNRRLHKLISAYETYSNIPILINTSFNERGEPIVHSPTDAIKCFLNTEMDILVLGDIIVYKAENLAHQTNSSYELD